MIRFADWNIEIPMGLFARQYDHLSRRIEVQGDLPEGWEWAALVQVGDALDIISLQPLEGGVGAILTAEQLSVGDAWYQLQLRGTKDGEVRHTNVVRTYVPASLSGSGRWPEIPSEFAQAEQRILELNGHPPVPGDAGYWMVWDPDADRYVQSEIPLPAGGGSGVNGISPIVTLAETEAGVDISVRDAEGTKTAAVKHGKDGIAPHIGANGNWWLGDEDTDVSASGGGGSTGGGGGNASFWTQEIVLAEEVNGVDIDFPVTLGNFAVLNLHFEFPGLAAALPFYSITGGKYKGYGDVPASSGSGTPAINLYWLRWDENNVFSSHTTGAWSNNARPGACTAHVEHVNAKSGRFYSNKADVNFPVNTKIVMWGVYGV